LPAAPVHALRGISVVDFGQWMAGPAAAMLLADSGADVTHIDPPDGPRWMGGADEILNRGKRRVRLDLNDAADLAKVRTMVGSADVVIENFRPGALARLGLDYDSLQPSYPGLVYLSLPGFASTDPDHQDVAAYEGVIAAAVGQFADMGVNRVLMGVEASYSPLPLGSAYAAVFGAMAVTLALRARLRHGRGDHIEVPIASSLLEALAYNSMEVDDLPHRYRSRREAEIARRREDGRPMDLSYQDLQELLDPFYRTYWCSDGRPLYLVAVSHRVHPRRVLDLLGIYDEAREAGLPMFDPYLLTADWPPDADCTLYAHPISDTWAGWLSERIARALRTRTAAQWERIFGEAAIPAVAHRTTKEWLASEHARASGLVVNSDWDGTGPTTQMGPVTWLEHDLAADRLPSPSEQSPPSAPDPATSWLDGITVVDLTNVIAGPTIGSTLARFGARVIKVDPPRPTFDPWNTVVCGLHANRGKESVLLDARHRDGKAALGRLLQTADVVTVNASSRQLTSLGLAASDLAGIAPHAVLCHLDAWSGPDGGPWSDRPGYDDLVQAATGIMSRFGGGLSTPEEHAHFGTIDVLGGLCGALSAAMALYTRDTTGQVTVARTSLAAAGQLIQAPFMYDHASRPPWNEPAGREVRGEGPAYRLYRALDSWMFVVIPDRSALTHLGSALQHDLSDLPDDELTAAMARAFATRATAHWRQELAVHGVSIQPLQTLSQLRAAHTDSSPAPWSRSSFHFTRIADHPAGHAVTLVAPIAVRPRGATVTVPHDAPRYGQHTQTVLLDLGYRPAEIEELLSSGAAGQAWSTTYLPD
jgi:crotonobetainyl-CoA:carnitine CoA-transferase CaiB-like acyl-CoA transferase